MFKEKCWFVYGLTIGPFVLGKLVYVSEGEAHCVEFDWEKGLSKFLIGWFHTHPKNCSLSPSSEDERTMKSWVRTLERPLLCGITHNDLLDLNCFIFKRWPAKKVNMKPLKKSKLYKHFFIGIA